MKKQPFGFSSSFASSDGSTPDENTGEPTSIISLDPGEEREQTSGQAKWQRSLLSLRGLFPEKGNLLQ